MSGQQEIKKPCKKCAIVKPLSEFRKNKGCRDGHLNNCLPCMQEWARNNRAKNLKRDKANSLRWYYENKEKAREQNKRWSQENREKRREHSRKSNQKNKEKCLERGKIYREKNRDKIREGNKIAGKKWRAKNKEDFARMCKDWHEKNRERHRELVKQWDKRNPEKRKAFIKNSQAKRRTRIAGEKISAEDWKKVLQAADGKCHYCKQNKQLTMDHVTPLSKGGRHHISNVVPACISCNSSKGNKIVALL